MTTSETCSLTTDACSLTSSVLLVRTWAETQRRRTAIGMRMTHLAHQQREQSLGCHGLAQWADQRRDGDAPLVSESVGSWHGCEKPGAAWQSARCDDEEILSPRGAGNARGPMQHEAHGGAGSWKECAP
jgi:hypothetical protein